MLSQIIFKRSFLPFIIAKQAKAASVVNIPVARRRMSRSTKKAPTTKLADETAAPAGRHNRARMSAESVAVIITGWPDPQAVNVAKACLKRGYQVVPFGLTSSPNSEKELSVQQDIPQIEQPIRLAKFSDEKSARDGLQKELEEIRKNEKFAVIVDTTPEGATEHVKLYNDLKVPFVLQSRGGESHQKAVRDTEEAKSTAMITEKMNKRLSVMDQMWSEWSRRYPGTFDEFDFFFKSSHPQDTPKSLMDSFSDLVNRELGMDDIQPLSSSGDKSNLKVTQGHLTREYQFRNGSGSSTFSFQQSTNDEQEFAESAADSVGFLAQKSQELARPQVYSILDVAMQHPSQRMLGW